MSKKKPIKIQVTLYPERPSDQAIIEKLHLDNCYNVNDEIRRLLYNVTHNVKETTYIAPIITETPKEETKPKEKQEPDLSVIRRNMHKIRT